MAFWRGMALFEVLVMTTEASFRVSAPRSRWPLRDARIRLERNLPVCRYGTGAQMISDGSIPPEHRLTMLRLCWEDPKISMDAALASGLGKHFALES